MDPDRETPPHLGSDDVSFRTMNTDVFELEKITGKTLRPVKIPRPEKTFRLVLNISPEQIASC